MIEFLGANGEASVSRRLLSIKIRCIGGATTGITAPFSANFDGGQLDRLPHVEERAPCSSAVAVILDTGSDNRLFSQIRDGSRLPRDLGTDAIGDS